MLKRDEETKLLTKLSEYKREFGNTFENDLKNEIKKKREEGKWFFCGFWLNEENVSEINKLLCKRRKSSFIELFFLIGFMILFSYFLLIVFDIYFLP